MSKNVSDILFRFIKSLNPTEKRYFKLYASRHTIGKKNEYLKMFEAIDRMIVYDEASLKKTFRQLKAKNSLSIAKNRLYETILRSLDAYHSESSIDVQLRSQLHYVEILFKKSLYDESTKMVSRAKKLAERYEKHSIMLDINKWEKRLIEKDGYSTVSEEDLRLLHEADLLILDKMNNYTDFWNLKSRLFFMLNRYGKVREKEELENFKTIIDNVLLKSEDAALTYETRYLYTHIYSAYYFGIGDYVNSYQYIKQHLALMEANPEMLQEEPNKYFAALSNVIYLCTQINKHHEIPKHLARLKDIPSMLGKKTTEDLEIKLFSTSKSAELTLYIQTGQFRKAEAMIPAITAGLKKYKGKINTVREAFFYFNIAIVCFAAGKFNEALKWLNRLLNDSHLDANQDIHAFARIFDLVVHLEIGNNELIPYTLRSVQRYLTKRKRMYKFETVFLDFVKVISRSRSENVKQKSITLLYNELLKLSKDPFEKPVFDYFDFLTWAESHLNKKGFAETVRRKVGESKNTPSES